MQDFGLCCSLEPSTTSTCYCFHTLEDEGRPLPGWPHSSPPTLEGTDLLGHRTKKTKIADKGKNTIVENIIMEEKPITEDLQLHEVNWAEKLFADSDLDIDPISYLYLEEDRR